MAEQSQFWVKRLIFIWDGGFETGTAGRRPVLRQGPDAGAKANCGTKPNLEVSG
jgi:hypothetical protein